MSGRITGLRGRTFEFFIRTVVKAGVLAALYIAVTVTKAMMRRARAGKRLEWYWRELLKAEEAKRGRLGYDSLVMEWLIGSVVRFVHVENAYATRLREILDEHYKRVYK